MKMTQRSILLKEETEMETDSDQIAEISAATVVLATTAAPTARPLQQLLHPQAPRRLSRTSKECAGGIDNSVRSQENVLQIVLCISLSSLNNDRARETARGDADSELGRLPQQQKQRFVICSRRWQPT